MFMGGERLPILGFGGQYAHLISERFKDLGYHAEIIPCETPWEEIREKYGCCVLSGGPNSVYDEGAPVCDERLFSGEMPVLGICYGAQLMVYLLGGKVKRGEIREYGRALVRILRDAPLFDGLEEQEAVWMSHGDSIVELPEGFERMAESEDGITAVVKKVNAEVYGVQFHPEVSHTPKGLKIMDNFAGRIAGCPKTWTNEMEIEDALRYIESRIGNSDAGCMWSSGVDSTVATRLVQMRYPDAFALYVAGLDRKDDEEGARRLAKKCGIKNLVIKDATDRFAGAVSPFRDPQKVREAVGNVYVDVFDEVVREMGMNPEEVKFVQGTLYTDKVESGVSVDGKADNIKLHHNVGCRRVKEKDEMGLLVEPNGMVYKDGARRRAGALGLPDEMFVKKPFPGPGLAVRMIRDLQMPEDWEDMYRKLNEILAEYGMSGAIHPARAVGVKGDERAYLNVAVTAGFADFGTRRAAANRVVNSIPKIGRVAHIWGRKNLDYSDQLEFGNIKPLDFSAPNLRLLREYDQKARNILKETGAYDSISQDIFVLVPGCEGPCLAVRCMKTKDYMTAEPFQFTEEQENILSEGLLEPGEVTEVMFDFTDKPPATMEWL